MTALGEELALVLDHLRTGGRPVALVGGLAVSARSEPRLTRDADLAVSVDGDAQAETLLTELRRAGYHIVAVVEHEPSGRLATARVSRSGPDEGIVTDLLFASTGIEPEIVAAAEPLEILRGLEVPVARVGHLIAMKALAREDRLRPNDADDLRNLAVAATTQEWDRAAMAASLISERGFDRGRDLGKAIAELRAEQEVAPSPTDGPD
ncbi:MAG: nucleotidyl transferase AbiEii/AbiGii toxin family protein [Acidimicrobiales bacterium]